ncbi:MAG: hypothetical protein AB1758_34465, partial [Candidatus Eremiobacterota bacterium]
MDAPGRSLDRPFTYRIPDALEVVPGSVVEVPFATRQLAGFVLQVGPGLPADLSEERVRPVTRVLDPEPFFGRPMLELA